MRKLVLAAVVALFVACAAHRAEAQPPYKPTDITVLKPDHVFWKQVDIIAMMNLAYPRVVVGIVRTECGQANAFYFSRKIYKDWGWKVPTIVLCSEVEKYPSAAVKFAAHEMAHAITDYYTDTIDEQDADELAALSMIRFGFSRELHTASVYYLMHEIQGHLVGDPHPPSAFRSWFLRCMQEGSEEDGSQECQELYRSTELKWEKRLSHEIVESEWITLDLEKVLKNPLTP